MPHAVTKIDRNTHGIHARMTIGRVWVATAVIATLVRLKPAKAGVRSGAPGNSQTSRGFHTRQNSARHASDTRPPMMSTSSGPTKLLQKNWTIANVPPHTATAGHTP